VFQFDRDLFVQSNIKLCARVQYIIHYLFNLPTACFMSLSIHSVLYSWLNWLYTYIIIIILSPIVAGTLGVTARPHYVIYILYTVLNGDSSPLWWYFACTFCNAIYVVLGPLSKQVGLLFFLLLFGIPVDKSFSYFCCYLFLIFIFLNHWIGDIFLGALCCQIPKYYKFFALKMHLAWICFIKMFAEKYGNV